MFPVHDYIIFGIPDKYNTLLFKFLKCHRNLHRGYTRPLEAQRLILFF